MLNDFDKEVEHELISSICSSFSSNIMRLVKKKKKDCISTSESQRAQKSTQKYFLHTFEALLNRPVNPLALWLLVVLLYL